ncbi:MAG: PhoX family phosphatase [Austwickia sp.]|nr:PhoX family phosphatase [Austwickia sp.]MBK8436911.1 PhoX family phosphatase [Austwickia sp.]MBK9100538.1 PhoX family phosphatase [Austwickia sp.]
MHATGGRAKMTCRYRCSNQCSHPAPNTSANEYLADIIESAASRRSVLKAGGLGVALMGMTAGAQAAAAQGAIAPAASSAAGLAATSGSKTAPFGFTPIGFVPAATDKVVVPKGFDWRTIIAWGDPLFHGTPRFDVHRQSAAAQKRQFGYNNDYVALLPYRHENCALLVTNHEYVNPELMFEGFTTADAMTDEQLKITMAAHGMTVVELMRKNPRSPWTYIQGARLNRRITATTPFDVVGPAAGHDLLKTSADPSGRRVLGTLNNCAGGRTPWGTVLSGEENFHGYFKPAATPTAHQKRYGITDPYMPPWHRIDPRFDLSREPNEVHRFGWVVEIDPYDPDSTPRKLTALGRVKHEGAETAIAADGRVAVYTGDDERFEYAYKFLSRKKFERGNSAKARAHNRTLLEEGDLYVAKFTGDGGDDGEYDGTGRWLPLVKDGKSMVAGMSVAEVLIFTRMAADAVGATKMDRPEDFQPSPVTDSVYLALTNNSKRTKAQVDEANPRAENKHGHVIEISDTAGHTADTFRWKIVLLCGDPKDPATYFNGFDKSQVSAISCPDNVTFDKRGNLWISTDGAPSTLKKCDGLYLYPLEGSQKGHLQQFLSVPAGAECCGPYITDDQRTVLAAVQHPGELDGATFDKPASRFPYRGDPVPRPSVIQVYASH